MTLSLLALGLALLALGISIAGLIRVVRVQEHATIHIRVQCGHPDCVGKADPRCKGFNCTYHCQAWCPITCATQKRKVRA